MAQKLPGKQLFSPLTLFFRNHPQSSVIRQKCLWGTMIKLSGHLNALWFPPTGVNLSYINRNAVMAKVSFAAK
jgi:hypothetical protein